MSPLEQAAKSAYETMIAQVGSYIPEHYDSSVPHAWEDQPADLRRDWINSTRAALRTIRGPLHATLGAAARGLPVGSGEAAQLVQRYIDEMIK